MHARANGMGARFVALPDVDDRLLARWRELAADAIEPNPFAEPCAVLPAGRLLDGTGTVRLLIVESGTDLVFAMPTIAAARFRRVPVPALSSWQHDHSFLGTPLVAPGANVGSWSAVLDLLRSARPAPWCVLGLLATEGPVVQGLSAVLDERRLRPSWAEPYHRAVVRRRAEPSYLEGRVSARRLKSLRRLRRRLGDALDSDVLTVDHAAGGDIAAAQETFLRVEASGWKARDGGALACHPAQAAFFRELCRGFAAEGRLQLWTLGSSRCAVAAQCNLIAGDTVFHFKIAYDEAYAHYSPGVQLELDMLDAFHADGRLRLLDSCTATDDSVSNQLYPDRLTLGTMLIPVHGPRGYLAARTTPRAARWYRRLRRVRSRPTTEGARCGS